MNNDELFILKNNFAKKSDIKSTLVFSNDTSVNPFLSICVPTYKIGDNFKRTLESIAHLSNKRNIIYNVIIIDDFPDSNFDVKTLIESYGLKNVKYYKNDKNLGLFGNWNRCIELSDSNYVALLHDDDLLNVNYIDSIYKIIHKINRQNSKELGFLKCSTVLESNKKKNITFAQKIKSLFKYKYFTIDKKMTLYSGNPGYIGDPTCGTILSKKAFMEYGGFNEELYPTSDAFLPFFMLDKYGVYQTVASYGTKVYAQNVSCKFETLKLWARMFVLFQNYLANNYDVKNIQKKYKNEQYALYVETFYDYAKGGLFEYNPHMLDEFMEYNPNNKKKKKLSLKIKLLKLNALIKAIF